MTGKPVAFAAAGAASAEGGTSLNAFDNALLAAGLGDINLVKVSSIMPPKVEMIPLPRLKPGRSFPRPTPRSRAANLVRLSPRPLGGGCPPIATRPASSWRRTARWVRRTRRE